MSGVQSQKMLDEKQILFIEKICEKGIFLTPKIKHLTDNIENCRLIQPIQYSKHYYIEVAFKISNSSTARVRENEKL